MPAPVVLIAERLAKPHADPRPVTPTRWKGAKQHQRQRPRRLQGCREERQRAFLILDALFKAFEAVHASVTFTETGTNSFAIKVNIADRPPVELWMTEHLKRSPHVATEDEKSWGVLFVRKYD